MPLSIGRRAKGSNRKSEGSFPFLTLCVKEFDIFHGDKKIKNVSPIYAHNSRPWPCMILTEWVWGRKGYDTNPPPYYSHFIYFVNNLTMLDAAGATERVVKSYKVGT